MTAPAPVAAGPAACASASPCAARRHWCLHTAAWGAGLSVPLFARAGRLGAFRSEEEPSYASALVSRWGLFKARFTRPAGPGQLRVVDLANGEISHSEGQGVGMLAAQAAGDRAGFEALWRFCQRMRNARGLLAWRWEPDRGVQRDPNNASDGDLYVAWALSQAGERWAQPEWTCEAGQILRALRTHCVREVRGKAVLLPGAAGFDSPAPVVNPSCWVLPAMRDLARLDELGLWTRVSRDSLSLMTELRFGPQLLPADWAALADPPQPWAQRPARFGYEAIRVPLFLAWAREFQHPALLSCAAFMRGAGFAAWQSLTGPDHASWPAPRGFEAVACLLRTVTSKEPLRLADIDDDYYSSSLTLLTCLALASLRMSAGDTAPPAARPPATPPHQPVPLRRL